MKCVFLFTVYFISFHNYGIIEDKNNELIEEN